MKIYKSNYNINLNPVLFYCCFIYNEKYAHTNISCSINDYGYLCNKLRMDERLGFRIL